MTAPRAVRIALCDDQALVLRGLSSLLADLGVEIALESTDAERLLAALPQRPVDLIVSDIRMPGLGGLGLLRELVRAAWTDSAPADAGLRLTERERSILRLVAGGYSNKEIARSLHLSEGTVKNYMSDVLVKLDCRDRTHAVLKAITQRLL